MAQDFTLTFDIAGSYDGKTQLKIVAPIDDLRALKLTNVIMEALASHIDDSIVKKEKKAERGEV